MKFLIDAHLPPSLRNVFLENSFHAIHTIDLPKQNDTQDAEINQFITENNYVLITKDYDFYDTFIIKQIPEKLILLRTGNIAKNDLIQLFKENLVHILTLLEEYDLLVLTKQSLYGYNQ
jgi:predicted nuclease of predicted toxin-antitoxin system